MDFNRNKRAGRLYGEDKTNRDFQIYIPWETGIHWNGETGEYFGLTYSSVSKVVSTLRKLFLKDKKLLKKYENVRAQFKM